jgi:Domain of unknown function (DUF3601)
MQESLSLWSSTLGLDKKYGFLTAGQSYRVVQPFIDFDKCVHLAGEQWQFVGTSFLARDDGRTWYVARRRLAGAIEDLPLAAGKDAGLGALVRKRYRNSQSQNLIAKAVLPGHADFAAFLG